MSYQPNKELAQGQTPHLHLCDFRLHEDNQTSFPKVQAHDDHNAGISGKN